MDQPLIKLVFEFS